MAFGAIFIWLCMLAAAQGLAHIVQDALKDRGASAWWWGFGTQYLIYTVLLLFDKPDLIEALSNAIFLTLVVRFAFYLRRLSRE